MLMLVFRGAVAGSNTPEATDRLAVLKDEITRLEDFEKVVDKHKAVRALLIWIQVKAIRFVNLPKNTTISYSTF